MALDGDPYRILGLAHGAPLDEVKRAYRRLVKAHHPDAAGSGALARFLAIQAAYEQLVEGPAGPGGKSRAPSGAARRASEADPDRADATRRAYGGRPRARRPTDGSAGRSRATGGPAADGGPAAHERPAQPGDAGQPDAEPGRRRGKATLGSTSYDDANTGAAEPDWSGANWYGTTSGTYWTINPKEYADPRKHGPEYQARARRAAGARPEPGGDDAVSESAEGPSTGPTDWHRVAEPPPLGDDLALDPARALVNLARALTDPGTGGLRGRVIRAFAGWLPVALGIGWLLGELTGCSRFAATCDPSVDPLILLAQGAVLVALFLSPSIAAVTAGAAIALLVAAVIATLVLSATGTAADEGSRRATLGLLLLVAWLAGLTIAVAQRVRAASSRVGPVS